MPTRAEIAQLQEQACQMLRRAGIVIAAAEKAQIEIADLGLNEFKQTGLGVLVYVNTERCCAKELVLWPRQTCPEHRHPALGADPGKEETFRCRWGKVFLYVPGEKAEPAQATPPVGRGETYTVWHEIELNPGDQYTLHPDTLHWFQAGDQGAIVSEFSTHSTDENDIFTDREINRLSRIAE